MRPYFELIPYALSAEPFFSDLEAAPGKPIDNGHDKVEEEDNGDFDEDDAADIDEDDEEWEDDEDDDEEEEDDEKENA